MSENTHSSLLYIDDFIFFLKATTTPDVENTIDGGGGGNETNWDGEEEAEVDWSSLITNYMKDQEFNR